MKLSFSPRSRIPPRVSKQVSQKINNRIFIEILVRSERFEISIQSERKRRERKRNELASLEIEESIVGLVCNGAACAGVKRQIGTYNGELWGVRERVKRIFHARWLKACTTTLLFTRAVLPLSFGEKKRKRKIFFEKQKCSSLVFPKLGGKIEISFSYFSSSPFHSFWKSWKCSFSWGVYRVTTLIIEEGELRFVKNTKDFSFSLFRSNHWERKKHLGRML